MTAKGGCRNGTEVVHVNRVHVGPRLGRVPKDVDLGEGQLIIFSILGEEDDTIVAHHHTVPRVLETYTVELAKAIVIGFGYACRNCQSSPSVSNARKCVYDYAFVFVLMTIRLSMTSSITRHAYHRGGIFMGVSALTVARVGMRLAG